MFWPHSEAAFRGATRCLRRMPIIDGHRCDCLRRSCREAGLLPRVELFERIRRDKRLEPGVGQRELARRHGVHRRTVRLALGRAVPPERKPPVRSRALLLEPVTDHIDAMLRVDLTAPRKQRHTIQRIYDRLLVEYDFKLACYSTVAHYVKKRRPQIIAGARDGHEHVQGMVDAERSFESAGVSKCEYSTPGTCQKGRCNP